MAIFIPFIIIVIGPEGAVNIFGGNKDDKPLTSELVNTAQKGSDALKSAGDPSQFYGPPYTSFLTDCCFPAYGTIFDKAKGGGTYNEIRSESEAFYKEAADFADKNNIDTSQTPTPLPEKADNSVDEALLAIADFNKQLKINV